MASKGLGSVNAPEDAVDVFGGDLKGGASGVGIRVDIGPVEPCKGSDSGLVDPAENKSMATLAGGVGRIICVERPKGWVLLLWRREGGVSSGSIL